MAARAPRPRQGRGRSLPALLALLASGCSDGAGPDPAPRPASLATTFVLVVTDSLGQGVGGAHSRAWGWVGDVRHHLQVDGRSPADADGRTTYVWPASLPVDYDSITFEAPGMPCRPYAPAHAAVGAAALRGLPGDSSRHHLALGLASAPPLLTSGAELCAAGEKEFGALELWLALDSVPADATDSVRAQWDIHFRETSVLYVDDAAGVIRGDSLSMHLRIDAPRRCAPGYLLRARLQQGRLGVGVLDPLNHDDDACGSLVRTIHPLHFVPMSNAHWP